MRTPFIRCHEASSGKPSNWSHHTDQIRPIPVIKIRNAGGIPVFTREMLALFGEGQLSLSYGESPTS
jgi:hypothetical protein